VRRTLLFSLINQDNHGEVWKSDGTPGGTAVVQDIGFLTDPFEQTNFDAAGESVFLVGNERRSGRELWALAARPGVDAYVQAPALVGAAPGGAATIYIQYSNVGTTAATGTVLTATLNAGLTYLGDTSGISPTVSGQAVVWRLPEIGFLASKQFVMRVRAPAGRYGDRYPIALTLTSTTPETLPADNRADVIVLIARQVYLPVVGR
jgi:uncharacterized repeat protein (TIGR01451 family)